ncbi:MAG TPA: xanthine dehydrogenase family protein subunit M [Bryobacteraceae bacterium]|nr:xanthine dehydrogenase family protein subunit M [Bryobacteraceae bacterium]
MISQEFEYSSPATLKEALALLADGSAKVLAGGMSLIPLMKLRLAAPEHVVDMGRICGLDTITQAADGLHIGAMATHYQIESSVLLRAHCPLLAETASHIGDVQVRNMGTIGGSVAHCDPAADYPAALFALEAQVRLASAGGQRTLSFADFLVDTFTTALEPGEIVTEIIVPAESAGAGVSYQKLHQPASGFALVGIAARVARKNGGIGFVRVGVTGLAAKAYRAANVESALLSTGDVDEAAALVAQNVEANSDLNATADYRCHLARVYTARALKVALARTS